MSTLKQVFSCLGSQWREGHFQGGVHLSHHRIASLGYNAITWHYLTISNSSYQFETGAFYLKYYFRHLHLSCGHLLVSVTPSCTISDGSVWVSSCTSGRAWTWLYCRPGVEEFKDSKEFKPGSQLQNLTPTDCYSITIDAIQKSRVSTALVLFHVYKKKLRMFWNSVEWPLDQRLNTLTHQISVIKVRGFRCGV